MPRRSPSAAVLPVLAACLLVGCRVRSAGVLTDLTTDYNRYRACTVRVERRSHLPSRTDHIRQMRWQHGEPPVLPACEERALRGPEHHRVGLER